MSLLPQQMLPPNVPLGQVNENGMVIPTENYWLFFYNLWLNTIATGLPADAIESLESVDFDISSLPLTSSPLSDGQAINDLPIPILSPVFVLQDEFLPDPPAAQAAPVASITVTASPFTYTAPFAGNVAVTGGTVSAITLIRQSTSVATGLTVGLISVSRGDQVQVTYSVTPTLTFIPGSPA